MRGYLTSEAPELRCSGVPLDVRTTLMKERRAFVQANPESSIPLLTNFYLGVGGTREDQVPVLGRVAYARRGLSTVPVSSPLA